MMDWQVSHLAQVLSHFFANSNVAHLKPEVDFFHRELKGIDDVE